MANKKYRVPVVLNWELFRKRLQGLLDSHNLNATRLANELNIAVPTITRYFYETTPDLTTAWLIADYFNVSLDWLVGRRENVYDEIPEEVKDLTNKLLLITKEDRAIIDAVLAKYDK